MTDALRTSRLVLRQWRDDDAAAFAELSADPAVMQYLVPFADCAAMHAWVVAARTHWQDHGFGSWVAELPGEALMIGVVGLSNLRFALTFAPAVLIGDGVMPMRRRGPRSTTDSAGSVSTRSSPSRYRRTGRRGGSWKSSG